MKHFTHITTGIVLGLAVMFTGIGQANATLLVLWSNGIGHLETPEAYCGPGGE
jgi:hypothetical protein